MKYYMFKRTSLLLIVILSLIQLCVTTQDLADTTILDDHQAYLELLQLEKETIDPSTIPKVEPVLPKIRKLREMYEQGKLPKDSDAFSTMEQICHKYGFQYEEHTVTTDDGYILTLARIPGLIGEEVQEGSSKPVITLQHGMANMMQWIWNTPETTHPFVLARAGYDVWMGNNRGTLFSQKHVSLNASKDSDYWQFTWEEMGTKDQVAFIEYILNLTKQENLSYMGHSEGTTQLLAGGSLNSEFFNQKINVAILLAPPAAMVHCPNKIMRFVSSPPIMTLLDKAARTFNFLDWIPYNLFISKTTGKFCSLLNGQVCEIIYAAIFNLKTAEADRMDRDDIYLSYEPTDTGAFNFEHYGQLFRTKSGEPEFRRYDHGKEMNMKKYNQNEPPHYNLTNLGFPIAILHGSYDDLADPQDVAWLHEQIKDHVIHYEELPFGHMSFQIAKDMSYLTKTVLPILDKYNNKMRESEEYQMVGPDKMTNAVNIPESINSLEGILI